MAGYNQKQQLVIKLRLSTINNDHSFVSYLNNKYLPVMKTLRLLENYSFAELFEQFVHVLINPKNNLSGEKKIKMHNKLSHVYQMIDENLYD